MALPAGPKRRGSGDNPIPPGLDALGFAEWWGWAPYEWQRDLLVEYCAPTRPRMSYVQIARKNGKSAVAAAVAIDEMVRLGGQVFLIADSERNLKSALFHELNTMVSGSPQLLTCVLQFKDHLECPSSGGRISLRPNNLSASQSINPDLVLFDEVHMQRTDSVWNGMALAGAASPRSLLLGITTPGYDQESMAHGLYQAVRAEKMHGHVWEPNDPNAPVGDTTALLEANPVLRERPDMWDVFEFERGVMPEHDYRRFRLGQWTATSSAFFEVGVWDRLTAPVEYQAGERLWLGFDGSYSGDSTALVACNGSGHVKVMGLWENPGIKGWRVPRDEVQAVVHRTMNMYDATLHPDPHPWEGEIAAWDKQWPGRVIEYPWNSIARSVAATMALETAVLEGSITHDGDGRMAAHVSHCTRKDTPGGTTITKPSPWSPAKIDAAVAAAIAIHEAVISPPSDMFIGAF